MFKNYIAQSLTNINRYCLVII